MAAPSNYDNAGLMIRVDPNSLHTYATSDLVNEAQNIADGINSIVGIWNGLKLGWVGTTASEAQAFNDSWTHAVNQVFGTQADPKSGALNKIADAVALASINYGEAEDVVQKNFDSLSASLSLGALQSAIQQKFPPAPGTAPLTIGPPPGRNGNGGPMPDPINENAPTPP